MKLKKVILENIRSYEDQEINLPEGSVLLAGDIGSGKSTVLLAVDFALFGLGNISGASLLRNGEKIGSVELGFDVEGKDVVVRRTLKKGVSISQDSGYISINGDKREATATEIKQAVLKLLNYPSELLTKSKSLIFRYTVYTPQEEMKSILLGDKEDRLNILRRVFGIDKYRTIKENAERFIVRIKEKKREFAGMIADLEDKIVVRDERKKELKNAEERLKGLEPEISVLVQEVDKKKKDILKAEEQIKEFNELKKEISVLGVSLEHKSKILRDSEGKLEVIKEEINKMDVKEIKEEKARDYVKDIEDLEKSVKNYSNLVHELKIKIKDANSLIEEISKLDVCPTCQQRVATEHKHKVIDGEGRKIKKLGEDLKSNEILLRKEEEKLSELRRELDRMKDMVREREVIKLKLDNLNKKKDEGEKLDIEIVVLKTDVDEILRNTGKINEEIRKLENVDSFYNKLRSDLEKLNDDLKKLEITRAGYEKEAEDLKEVLSELEIEIENKNKTKDKLIYLTELQSWIEEHFINLMGVIERKIMLKVHNDFNSLFQKWFSMLIENEVIKINLDEEFSPLIEQNGHLIEYEYLSGGEKTAAALAYRLALNQIINNLITTIKTKDLIILDEPTDGFSDEQLDRMRNVLDELNMKQIIIVSHEAKIESFVNHVIKIEKEGHVSKVI